MEHTPHATQVSLLKTILLIVFSIWIPSVAFSDLYIAGTNNNQDEAFLWIVSANGQVQQITLPGGSINAAVGVAVTDNQVYISGTVTENDVKYASLWMGDLDGSNIQLITFTDVECNFADGVAIENSKVYMVGTFEEEEYRPHGAYLLITNLDGTNLQETTLSTASGSASLGVAVNSYYAYLAGTDGTNPILWICNAGDGSLVNTITLQAGGITGDVTLANNSVYIAGGNNANYYVTDLDGSNLQTITPTGVGSNAVFPGIAVASQIYIAVGNTRDDNPPELLIANLAGTRFQNTSLAAEVGQAEAVTVSNEHVCTVGHLDDDEGNPIGAYLWITALDGSNVQQIFLGENAIPFTIAGTVPPLSNPLWKAFQLYNPLKNLKGVGP